MSPDNPFITRHIRPGAIPYLFPDATTIEQLVARLKAHAWRGEIVGPHGSGKTTLLAQLLPRLREHREVTHVVLNSGQRRLPTIGRLTGSSLLVIDGYEQLSWWSRIRLWSGVRWSGAGLLVVTHASVGLPLLWQTMPNVASVEAVVRCLGVTPEALPREEVERAFVASQANIRETLFALYDWYERHNRRPVSSTTPNVETN